MPDGTIDTSSYPKTEPLNLLQMFAQGQAIANARQENQLLQTRNKREQVGLSQDQIDQAHGQYGMLSGALTALSRDSRIATDQAGQAVDEIAGPLVRIGAIPQNMFDAEKAQLLAAPPALRTQLLQNMSVRALDGQQQFTANYGQSTMIHDGNRNIPVRAGPIAGVQRIGADVMDESGPDFRNTMQSGKSPSGEDVLIPQGQLIRAAGQNPLTGQPLNPGNRLANAGMSPSAAPTMRPQPGGGVAVSPPAGELDAQKNMATASAGKYSADQQAETNYQNDLVPMTKALGALQTLGPTGTGPGSQTWNDLRSFFITQGAMDTDDKTPVYDVAKKYLTQLGRQSGDTGTNDKLAAAFAGSPSTNISNAGAQEVLKTMISMRKLQNARVQAFAATNLPASQYQKWAVNFGKTQDPVAYGADLMTGEDRMKYFQGLSKPDQTKFLASYRQAKQFGLVNAPAAGGANGG